MTNQNSTLVYSTEGNLACNKCRKSLNKCQCHSENPSAKNDGIIRVRREIKGRRGKTVTTIHGFGKSADDMHALAAELKKKCGTGGSVKAGIILIQGDRVDQIVSILKEKNLTIKKSGG